MAVFPRGMYSAFDFRSRGFIAPHRVYCNGDHGLLERKLLRRGFNYFAAFCTDRSGGTRGATYRFVAVRALGVAGLLRASWARRLCVRAFECRLFGFGILFPLLGVTSV